MRDDCVFFAPVKVRYHELDPQGIVHNANYILYSEVALGAFFQKNGYSYKELSNVHQSEICHKKTPLNIIQVHLKTII